MNTWKKINYLINMLEDYKKKDVSKITSEFMTTEIDEICKDLRNKANEIENIRTKVVLMKNEIYYINDWQKDLKKIYKEINTIKKTF